MKLLSEINLENPDQEDIDAINTYFKNKQYDTYTEKICSTITAEDLNELRKEGDL